MFPGGVVDGHEKVPHADEVSRRVAVCNIDWTNITAADLFVLANSFKTPTGAVESVVIYPSDFGLEAMAQEAKEGPVRFLKHATQAGKGVWIAATWGCDAMCNEYGCVKRFQLGCCVVCRGYGRWID